MNQILITKDDEYYYENISISNFKKRNKYWIIFISSLITCIIIIFYLLFQYFSNLNNNYKSNILKNKYNLSTLYSSNQQLTAIKLSNNISIIGLIEIPQIDISYPILSNTDDELLKISVCRFAGPLPNRIGNLCIAGHNYKNNLMFSNLNKLNLNDSIYITDLNNVRIRYDVYKKFKTKENDLSCISNTLDNQITLITCNNNNNKERIIIKAKTKE